MISVALLLLLSAAPAPSTVEEIPVAGNGGDRLRAVADASAVYWAEHASGKVRMRPEGGHASTLVSGRTAFVDLAVDDEHVFFLARATESGPFQLERVRKDPGSTVFTLVPDVGAAMELSAGSGVAVWATRSELRAVSVSGGAPFTLASGQYLPHDLTVTHGEVCWVNQYAPSTMVQRTSGEIFAPQLPAWMEAAGKKLDRASAISSHAGSVGCVSVGGGKIRWVAADEDTATFATDGTTAFWVNQGALYAAPLQGGARHELYRFPSGPGNPRALIPEHMRAFNGGLLWIQAGVLSRRTATGAVEMLTTHERKDFAWSLVTTATSAYWTDWSGHLFRFSLP